MLEVKATLAQVGVFVAGLTLSLVVGMFLGAHLGSAVGLLMATLIAGTGLLAAAVFSQVVHDHILISEPEIPLPPVPPPSPSKKKK
jgi:predicted MFS family arabinose efflux permease